MKIGIYNLHMQAKGGGEKRTLVLAEHLSRSHSVWVFVAEPVDVASLESFFDVDLSRVSFVALDGKGRDARRRPALGARWEALSRSLAHFTRIKSFEVDVFINNSHCSDLPCPGARGIYMCMFPFTNGLPNRLRRIYHSLMDRVEERVMGHGGFNYLDSYAVITANSRFTGEWIEQLWGRCPELIYSVGDHMGPPVEKQKIILNVGRFVAHGADGLHKRQHVLLEVFKRLPAIHKQGWQLHFMGSVAQNARVQSLVERLTNDGEGCPVVFHFDADFDSLRELYRRSALYWQATGYGLPVREYPGLQEHFGMTTVEAMSAGAVPVVIDAGGQREIVTHGVDGFVWDDLTALADQTTRLITDSCLRNRFSQRAVLSSARFGRTAYNQRMDKIINRITM